MKPQYSAVNLFLTFLSFYSIEDVFENTPDDVPEGCIRSSDSAPKVNFQKGKIGSMAEGFIAAAEEANRAK